MRSSALRAAFCLSILAGFHAAGGQAAPELSLGKRTGAATETFSDAMGMAELKDGRLLVTDRIDVALFMVDLAKGDRKRIGTNGVGPNEYQRLVGPIRWRGDTLLGFDGPNHRALRITQNGTLAGTIPLPTPRMDGVHSFGRFAGVDRAGRVYWETAVITMQPVVKRQMYAQIVRWMPGTDSAEVVQQFADHAAFEDNFRFSPMRQTDAWVLAPDGRIGVLSAAEYRLRWYADGKVVETGPAIAYAPVRITAAEREAFWEKKSLEPSSGVSMNGGLPPTRAMGIERARKSWPDSLFPPQMPPFELQGAMLAPNGTVWVTRTISASEKAARIDVLDAHGAVRGVLRLPPKTRLFGLGAESVYLIATDDDGMQTLERYAIPAALKP